MIAQEDDHCVRDKLKTTFAVHCNSFMSPTVAHGYVFIGKKQHLNNTHKCPALQSNITS